MAPKTPVFLTHSTNAPTDVVVIPDDAPLSHKAAAAYAKLMGSFFTALRAEGFSREEAIQMVLIAHKPRFDYGDPPFSERMDKPPTAAVAPFDDDSPMPF